MGLLRWDLDKHCASKINKQTKKQNLICTKSVFRWLVKSIRSCAFELLFCPVKSCPCFSQPHPHIQVLKVSHDCFTLLSLSWICSDLLSWLLCDPHSTLPVSPLSRLLRLELLCAADTQASRTIQGEECHWTVSDNSPSQPASKTPRLPLEAYEAPLVFLNKPGLTILYVYAAFLEFDLSRLDFLSFLFCCWHFRFCHRLGQKMAKLMLNSRIRLLQSVQHPSRPLGADKACPHTWARPTWWGATTRAPAVQEARTDTPTPLYLPPPFPVRFRFDVHFGHYNPWQHPSFRCIWPRLCC